MRVAVFFRGWCVASVNVSCIFATMCVYAKCSSPIYLYLYIHTIESSAHNNAITLHTIENNLNGHIATYFIFGLVDGLTGHGNILIISIPLHVNLYHKNRRSSAQAIYPPQKLCIYSPLLSSLDSAFFTYKRLNRLLALSLSQSHPHSFSRPTHSSRLWWFQSNWRIVTAIKTTTKHINESL